MDSEDSVVLVSSPDALGGAEDFYFGDGQHGFAAGPVDRSERELKSFDVYIPPSLDLAAIVPITVAKQSAALKSYRDGVAYVLWKLLQQRYGNGTEWLTLNGRTMERQIGRHQWSVARESLVREGWMEVHHGYCWGQNSREDGTKSKRYRIPVNQPLPVKLLPHIITSRKLVSTIDEYRREQRQLEIEEVMRGEVVQIVTSNAKELEINYEAARSWARRQPMPPPKKRRTRRKRRLQGREGMRTTSTKRRKRRPKTREEYIRQLIGPMRAIREGKVPARPVSNFGWRLDAPHTALKRQARCYVTTKGEKLAGIDIRAAQPLMLAVLMTLIDDWQEQEYQQVNIRLLCAQILDSARGGLRQFLAGYRQQQSTRNYIDDCAQGLIYKRLAADGLSVADVKSRLFSEVYFAASDDIPSVHRGRDDYGYIRAKFAALYPQVTGLIEAMGLPDAFPEITPWFGDAEMKAEPHRSVAMALQRVESVLMRHHVVPLWLERTEGAWALTLHDALIVPASRAEEASRCVRDAVLDATGLGVQVKIEPWSK